MIVLFCLYVYAPLCAVPKGPEEGDVAPGTGVTHGSEPPCGG